MSLATASLFLKKLHKEATFRQLISDAPGLPELEQLVRTHCGLFSQEEFDDAFRHALLECQEEQDAYQLQSLRLWWELLLRVCSTAPTAPPQ